MISFEEKRRIWLEKFIENQDLFNGRIRENIETYRKGETTVRVLGEDGKPLSNARVKITQKTHDFGFGSHLFLLGAFENEEKNAEYEALFPRYFNLATLPFYWNTLEPTKGEPRFEKTSPYIYRRPAPDACLEYCKKNGIRPKLHCLVYDKFTPDWLPKRDMGAMEVAYEKHIREIAERYSGELCEFEVINETLDTYNWETASDLIKKTDFVEWAFALARKYLPNEILVINEGTSTIHDLARCRHLAPYFMEVDRARAKGATIDKIGVQYHNFIGVRSRTPEEYEEAVRAVEFVDPVETLTALDTLAMLGLPMEITEVTIPTFGESEEDEWLQAELLRYIYTMLFSHPAIDSIVYWNSVEGHCYDAGPGALWNENRCRGTLFHRDLTPKQSAKMLYHLIHEEWHTEYEATTDSDGNLTVRGFYGDYELCAGELTLPFGIHK